MCYQKSPWFQQQSSTLLGIDGGEDETLENFFVDDVWSTHVFYVEILRTNRKIYEEASATLYNDNLFVLIAFKTHDHDMIFGKVFSTDEEQRFPSSLLLPGAPLPPRPVQISHHYYHDWEEGTGTNIRTTYMVVAASDLNKLNYIIDHYPDCDQMLQICHISGELYALTALPQSGWSQVQLLNLIWLPLKDLRNHITTERRVIDCTGLFEAICSTADGKTIYPPILYYPLGAQLGDRQEGAGDWTEETYAYAVK